VMIPADPSDSGDNYQSQTPELIATATDGVNGSSGVVVLTRSGGYDDVPGDTPNPPLPYLPDMTVQYYVSGEFSPTGVPLSGTLHFSAGSTTPDDGEGIWTITDPDWGSIDPQGPESDTFDFTASDPYYSGASATVTIEPTPPPPSLTLTIGGQADSSDPYYLPLDNGNENNNTAEQWVTVTNPSDGTPETIPVLAPVTNIQQDRHLQNTVTANSNFGSPAANGVVEATLSISYPGVYTTGTLTFDFGDVLGVWWHGAQNQYDRWVPISQGASFGGISANTSYTLLVQGIQDGSDGIDATFVPASSGSGSGGNSQVSGSLPINVFSVSVSISGPTEIVTGATSATEFTVDDGYDLGLTDSEGNLVADDSSTVTQIPLNGNDPYLQTATITFSETVPVGSPYNITIPSGYRLFDPTTGDLITVLSGTVPASRQVTVLVQVTDSAATGSSGGGFFSVADRILVAVMAVGADEPAIGDALAVAPRATTPVEIIRTRAGAANSSTFGPGVLEFGNVQWTFALSQPENVPMVMVQHITVKMSGSMFDPNAAGPGAKISAIGDQQLSYWEVLGTVPAGQLAPKINGKATTDTWFYSGLPENILFVAAKATIRGTVFAFPVSVIGKTIANWNQNTFPFDKQNGFPNIGDWSSGILKGNTDFAIQNAWKTGLWAQEAKTQVLTITFAPGRRNSNVPQLFKINTP